MPLMCVMSFKVEDQNEKFILFFLFIHVPRSINDFSIISQ